jgi:formamidopyrimidine-DNA glycosylase
MPELPEVETIVRDLQKKILKRRVKKIWTDFPKMIKKPDKLGVFKRKIKNKEILAIERKGKNIIFQLSEDFSLLIHQKLTGHLLYGGQWKRKKGNWQSTKKGPLQDDPANRFIHFILFFDNGKQLALSDLRKFAKIELWEKKEELAKDLEKIGPDALILNLSQFKNIIKNRKTKIKQLLLDQSLIAGIGNIYSDEALFRAGIHPLTSSSRLRDNEISALYRELRKILKKSIVLQGESFSDYRRPNGEKGSFDPYIKIYRRQGKKCFNCGALIKKGKLGSRSFHYCPCCQKIKK